MPLSGELSNRVADLRVTLSELRGLRAISFPGIGSGGRSACRRPASSTPGWTTSSNRWASIAASWNTRRKAARRPRSTSMNGECCTRSSSLCRRFDESSRQPDWVLDNDKVDQMATDLEGLQTLSSDLPTRLYDKIHGFAREVRAQYRTLIVGTWLTSVSAAIVLALLAEAVLSLGRAAATDPHCRLAEGGGGAVPAPHPPGHRRRDGRVGRAP